VLLAPLRNSLSFALELDFAQQQWLEANCEQKNDLYQFLNAHLDDGGEWQTTAEDFAKEAVDATTVNGDGDTCQIYIQLWALMKIFGLLIIPN